MPAKAWCECQRQLERRVPVGLRVEAEPLPGQVLRVDGTEYHLQDKCDNAQGTSGSTVLGRMYCL